MTVWCKVMTEAEANVSRAILLVPVKNHREVASRRGSDECAGPKSGLRNRGVFLIDLSKYQNHGRRRQTSEGHRQDLFGNLQGSLRRVAFLNVFP